MAEFLPVSRAEMEARGWYYCDFLLVTGDAYVDHPSFGVAVIARVLEREGFRVAILSQPRWDSPADFAAMGRPRYAVLVSGGNIDSMVAHYTVARRRRHQDAYSPGGKAGRRPDRALTVYARLARQAFGEQVAIGLGGLEASLRRFAHYDYWKDAVMPSVLESSGADFLMFGMGENCVRELAARLKAGLRGPALCRGVRGVCYFEPEEGAIAFPAVACPSRDEVVDKTAHARAAAIQYGEQDAVWGRAVTQRHGERLLVQNPPPKPLTRQQMDETYALPFTRAAHPSYDSQGGVPAIEEVRFSIIHNRGCFGACNFCSLAFHQGRFVSSRSHASVLEEARQITKMPDFKGYIHDVGGPTANFRAPACQKQKRAGLCRDKRCLTPSPCAQLNADHSDYLELLRKLRALPGVKKVFIRSGIRYDFLLADSNRAFFRELVEHHVSGQLKVAPEHCSGRVLYYMGKPSFAVFERFRRQYEQLNEKLGKKQYLVPYLMSSHPGSRLEDAIALAEYLNRTGHNPEQVQDFYPTPGTLSTAMYYSGLDPRTMKPVYVARDPEEKAMQRALLQWRRPEKQPLVRKALRLAGREDLIGYGRRCLVPPEGGRRPPVKSGPPRGKAPRKPAEQPRRTRKKKR